jgi:hypothetical protein
MSTVLVKVYFNSESRAPVVPLAMAWMSSMHKAAHDLAVLARSIEACMQGAIYIL